MRFVVSCLRENSGKIWLKFQLGICPSDLTSTRAQILPVVVVCFLFYFILFLASCQLGTLGAGNHYAEIQVVDEIFNTHAAKKMGVDHEGQVIDGSQQIGFGYL